MVKQLRSYLRAVVLLFATAVSWWDVVAAAQEPTALKTLQPFSGPRELLASLGVDDSYLRFADGLPLTENEPEALLRVLFALRRFDLADIERWTQKDAAPPDEPATAAEHRGEIYFLQGQVVRASLESVPESLAARFEMTQHYRCEVKLGEAKQPAVIFAHRIPNAWKLDAPLDERFSCRGFFLKLGQPRDGRPVPMFAALRLAWHKRDVLGDLEFDFGLFDDVTDKSGIGAQEKECFYQLLAACQRAGTQELLRRTNRPAGQDYSVVPLFNNADEQHGELVALTGVARRAIVVRLDREHDREIIERFGIDHYYQIEIFTQESQGNPLVFCVLKLPPGLPEGGAINEQVRIPAFFFKSWAYQTHNVQGAVNPAKQLAPMLVGREPVRIVPREAGSSTAGVIAGCLFLTALAGVCLWVWHWNRADRRFHRATLSKRFARDGAASLNDLGLEVQQEPDFRGHGDE